uniref:Uncharacterized protein n=1 Tax=Oryza punctata TaxID=4537 RepID=A0A0E0MEI5_ORYPU
MTPPSKLVSYTWIFWHPQGMFCLLVFSAIGRFSHGLPVLDAETFKTSDPFIDGWLLCAYLLGRFGDDAEVRTGVGKAAMLWPNPGCWDTGKYQFCFKIQI